MSVHYIIDGYNVLKQLPDLERRPLKEGRWGLIRYFEIYRPQGSSKNKVTLVFDGKSDVLLPPQRKLKKINMEIIFSQDETADDKIEKLVSQISNPKQVIVVTDDRELGEKVKIHGVKLLKVKEFAKEKFPKPDRLSLKAKTTLTIERAEKITKELEEFWLKSKSRE